MSLRRPFFAVVATLALLIPVSAAAKQRDGLPSATVGPLTLTYPAHFARRYFASCDYRVSGVHGACVHGVVVANMRLGRRSELGESSARLPLTVAKFELVSAAPQTGVVPAVPAYPLSLGNLRDACRGCGPLRGRPFRQAELFFRASDATDASYWAIAWIGKRISRHDYQALKSIVVSIRLP
jgi:hypothetical protein